jgi:hypothetical protein
MARELEIQITAETSQADQALARVESELGKVESAAGKAGTALDKNSDALKDNADASAHAARQGQLLTDVLMKYAGPTVILAAAKKTLDFADSVGELAQKTGFSIEMVQKLGNVAKNSGSSFQQISSSMSQLQKRLVEGNKGATEAIKGLGLSVEGLLKLNPDEQFVAIAKAVGGIEDPAKRAQAAMALFGRAGADLIPTMIEVKDNALDTAAALDEAFVKAGGKAQGEIDTLIDKVKSLGMAFILLPTTIQNAIGNYAANSPIGQYFAAIRTMLGMEGTGAPVLPGITPQTNAPLAPGGDPFAPGGVGGQSLSFVEDQLTDAVKENIAARKKNTKAAEELALAEFEAGALNQRLRGNEWASTARGGMFGPLWGQNIPGIGPESTFPGWATPMDPLKNSMNLGGGANWTGTGAWMLRQPVQSSTEALGNVPTASGGWFSKLFSGKAGSVLGAGLGMLPGLIPGLSGRGASVGGSAGSLIGSLVGGPLAPILGPIGGFLGGAVGKLFGKSEHAKVNDQRDEFVAAAGGINELNRKAQEAGLTLDRLLSAKKVKDFQSAVEELNGAFQDQEADQQRLAVAMEKYGLSIKDMGQAFKQTETNKGFKELGEDFRVLIGAGAEFNKVAEKMAPEFGALIHTAIETGTTVPRELEPILKKMIEMGVLTDKNGDKFTDLTQIPFAESMTAGFEKVVKAIEKLSAAIQGVAGDFDAAAGAANGLADAAGNIPVPGSGNPGGDNSDAVNVSRGGLIQGRGRVLYFRAGGEVPDMFRPVGTDTVPAMLTPGEVVLSRGMVRDLGPAMPSIIDGSLADIIRSGGGLIGDKGGDSPTPEVRVAPRVAPDAPRTQPVPFPRQGGGDVVVLSVPSGIDADGIADMVEKRLGRSLPGNRNRLRDVFDQLYERKRRRSA